MKKIKESIKKKVANFIRENITVNVTENINATAIYLGDYISLTKTMYGHKIYLDTRDISLTPHLLIDGYWENWITQLFVNTVKPGMRVIEVGANVGYYSLLAASIIGDSGYIYCFEANPRIYNLLKKSLEINGFQNRSKCINKAVVNSIGSIEFSILRDRMGGSSILDLNAIANQMEDTVEKIAVITTSLDEEIGSNAQVDILKIDAEGAEPLIIEGAKQILQNNYNIKIFMEFSATFFPSIDDAKNHLKILTDLGFKIHIINTDSKYESIEIEDLCSSKIHCELFLFRHPLIE